MASAQKVPLAKLSASAKSLVPGGVDDHVRSSIAAAADVIARLLAAVETNKPRTTGLVLAEASEFCRGSRENRIALGDVRAPQVLTHLLAPVPGSDREQIQKAACATMANLAVDKELSLKIGAIPGVFVGLSDLFSNRVCQPYAIAVIWTLAAQPDNRTKMPTTMAQNVVDLLDSVCEGESSEMIGGSPRAKLTQNQITTLETVQTTIKQRCCGAVCNMAADNRLRKAIAEAGAIRLLIQLLECETETERTVCLASVAALRNMAAGHGNCKAILAQGGLSRLRHIRDRPATAVAAGNKASGIDNQISGKATACLEMLDRAQTLLSQRQDKEQRLQQNIAEMRMRTQSLASTGALADSPSFPAEGTPQETPVGGQLPEPDGEEETPVAGWTVEMVCAWLKDRRWADEYVAGFEAAAIDGPTLLELGDDELKAELGITALGLRRKFLRERDYVVHRLKNYARPASPTSAGAETAEASPAPAAPRAATLSAAARTRELANAPRMHAASSMRQEIQAIEEDLQKAKLHLAAQSGFEDATSQPYTPVVTPVKK